MAMTAVLFVHGFPFDHFLWRHQVAALTRWHCLTPDLRGAGTSPAPASADAYSMGTYADDLIALLDRAKINQAVVCGLSLGGYIVFELLRRYPERVRAAILSNTKAVADTPEARRGRDVLAARALKEGGGAVAAELVPQLLARSTLGARPEVVGEVTEMILRQPVAGIVGALRALRERPDSTPLLSRIRIPILVIAGDDDQIAPAAGMLEMAHAIPGSEVVLVAEAGHLAPLEQPLAVNRALAGFLERLG